MKKLLDDIAKLLPEGISNTGIEEIGTLIEGVVTEKVEAEVSQLTAKVSGYLRMKIEEVKATALEELKNTDETYRAVQVYESLKAVDSLNKSIAHMMNENTTLETAVDSLREDMTDLHEIKKAPFKSSEKALVITNEGNESKMTETSASNMFLTEDVLRLSQQN